MKIDSIQDIHKDAAYQKITIGDADEGIEFGALTSEKAAKELWDTILEELEYYED